MPAVAHAATPIERAQEESAHVGKPKSRFALPDGKLDTTSTRLAAAGQTVRFSVDLDRPVNAARLALRLPALWVTRSRSGLPFARVPGSRDLAGSRARLRRDGRTLAVHFSRARASDTATIAIRDVGIPAGTYKLPYTWRDRAGTVLAKGLLSVVFYAPVREGAPSNAFTRMADLRNNATNDSAEESEAFDAVTPGDPSRVAVGINYNDPPYPFDAWISGDGGKTWTRRTMPSTMDRPGSTADEGSYLCCDPMFAADDAGNIWYGGLSDFNGASDPGTNGASRIVVNRIAAGSTDFQTKSTGLPIRTAGSAGQDKPMMTIDNSTGPTRGRLYVVWNEPGSGGGINLVLSFCDTFQGGVRTASWCDNSDHWSTPVSVTPAEGSYIYGDVGVGPDGRVYVTWWDFSSTNEIRGASCLPGGAVTCTSHADWSAPATIAQLDDTGGDPVPFACPIMAQPGGRDSPAPQLDVNETTGRVYVVWSDLHPGTATSTRCGETPTGDGTPPLITHQTWDSFVASAVNTLPGAASPSATAGTAVLTGAEDPNSDDWFPSVAVDQSSGQAYVDFYSTRGDTTRRTANFYMRSFTPGAATPLGTLTKLSSAPSDYSLTPCCMFDNDYGDYEGMAAAGGKTFPVWTDNSSTAGGDGDAFVIDGTNTPSGGGGAGGTPPSGGGTGTPTTPPTTTTTTQPKPKPPSADRTPPRLKLAARRTQHVRTRRLVVSFRPNETVTARFAATAGRRLRLRTIVQRVAGGRRVVVRFKLSRATRARIGRALRRGSRVFATVLVRAKDAAGNTSTTKLRIRLLL